MLAILTMAPISILGVLSALPLALAHMQMSSPSPLRDPHADRPNEPKDYNMLSPLNADGSNFACKGYHLNTPLTTVARYEAGSLQTIKLRGSATHGGGSCQISLSCDGGTSFKVIKSIIGGCPLDDSYDFKVPSDIPAAKQCLLAWTWFNRIGNREMYMNCAVVDITNRRSKRDSQAAAASALTRYPDLFVANLANINSCKIAETTDAIFDNPGKQVAYGNGDNASMQPSFGKGECTAKGSKNAGSTSGSQWSPPAIQQSAPQQNGGKKSASGLNCNDGQWHPECYAGSSRMSQQPAQQQQQQQQQQVEPKASTKESDTEVQDELDAYLATLHGRGVARRNMIPASEYPEGYDQKKEYETPSVVPHTHVHTENCKHKPTRYPGSHHSTAGDIGLNPEDGIDHSNKNDHKNYNVDYSENSEFTYKRTPRQKRWHSYTKRADDIPTPIQFHRADESPVAQQSQSSEPPVVRKYQDMTPAEQFDAFLRRMVELSNNMASLIKYATITTANVPYYPPTSTYERIDASTTEDAQKASSARKRARRGVLLSADTPLSQVYPGPSVGSISAPGDATDAEEGFKAWFPNLVQGLKKRQLVDPVTSEASAYAGDSVDTSDFDTLIKNFLKAFGDPFNILGDKNDAATEPVPTPEPAGEPSADEGSLSHPQTPDIDWNLLNDMLIAPSTDKPPNVDYPDFEIPDLDGHYTFPPLILAPEYPKPELMPGYVDGPDGPVWAGEGADPNDWSSGEPSTIIFIDPLDDSVATPIDAFEPSSTDSAIYPDGPSMTICVKPIPKIGWNSCWHGCDHSAKDIAAHNVYLANFAEEQREYEECLKNQTLNAAAPAEPEHGIYAGLGEPPFVNSSPPAEAPDASGRRPRPGHSHPLIPYPLPDNFTGPYPANESAPYALLNATGLLRNYTDSNAYHNKSLGELVSQILEQLNAPLSDLKPAPSNSSDDPPSNPLQEAADQAEEGITVPDEPVAVDPNALKSVADFLPWLLGPGPVITDIENEPDSNDDAWLATLDGTASDGTKAPQ